MRFFAVVHCPVCRSPLSKALIFQLVASKVCPISHNCFAGYFFHTPIRGAQNHCLMALCGSLRSKWSIAFDFSLEYPWWIWWHWWVVCSRFSRSPPQSTPLSSCSLFLRSKIGYFEHAPWFDSPIPFCIVPFLLASYRLWAHFPCYRIKWWFDWLIENIINFKFSNIFRFRFHRSS